MKAVCLLVCLALARHSAGSIFHRRHYNPSVDTLAQSADYIDPYLQGEQYQQYQQELQRQYQQVQQQQYQPEYQKEVQRNQYVQEQQQRDLEQEVAQQPEQRRYQQRILQRSQDQQGQKYVRHSQEQHSQEQHSQEQHSQEQHSREQHSQEQRSQEQARDQQYQRQALYRHEQPEQYEKYNQLQNQEQERRQHQQPIGSYIENGSQENIQSQNALTGHQYDTRFAAPRFADLDTPVLASRSSMMNVAYGDDAVEWRGLRVASSPESPVNKKDIERIFRRAQMATKHIQPETKTKLHEAVQAAAYTNNEVSHLNATELLKKYQYPVEEHTVKTEDGYYLTLFRIPPKQQTPEEKPRKVVFLMHGLLGSADDWLLMGPGKSLAYQLADAGYDVYLGNARGNKYTRHASMHRAQPNFWQYSNDEIALYDLPAMIDYVLKVSRQQKMYYVGHSQGTTAFFALAAARPEYNEKIAMMFALSPMVYMGGIRSPLVRMIAPSSAFYNNLNNNLGNGEFKPSKELVRTMGGDMCENEIGCKNMCSNVFFVMAGVNVENLEASQIAAIMSHLPAGASIKQMKQYGQAVDSNEFRMYDYGSEMNKKVYGKSQPPKYNMKKVTVPVVLYYSEHDWMANPKDVERLRNELPNATAHKIQQDYFSNTDFQFSKQAPEMVNKNLIEEIQKQQTKQHQSNKQ